MLYKESTLSEMCSCILAMRPKNPKTPQKWFFLRTGPLPFHTGSNPSSGGSLGILRVIPFEDGCQRTPKRTSPKQLS